jgi:hypothetical protein
LKKSKSSSWFKDCKKCGTEKLNHTWSKLNCVAMAKKDRALKQVDRSIVLPSDAPRARDLWCHFVTAGRGEIGAVSFIPTAQRREADHALMTAQNILLNVLGVQEERFKVPGLREQIQQRMQDFIEMHGKAEQESEPPTSPPAS